MSEVKVFAISGRASVTFKAVGGGVLGGLLEVFIYDDDGESALATVSNLNKKTGKPQSAGQGHMLIDFHGGAWGGIHPLDWKAALEAIRS